MLELKIGDSAVAAGIHEVVDAVAILRIGPLLEIERVDQSEDPGRDMCFHLYFQHEERIAAFGGYRVIVIQHVPLVEVEIDRTPGGPAA